VRVRLHHKDTDRPINTRRRFSLLDYLRRRIRQHTDSPGGASHSLVFEVEGSLALHLRRVARAKDRSPQWLASDLLTRGLEREALRSRTEEALASLTPREREVAWLAARGRTNRQIAAALVISQETVKSHVHSILAKFSLNSKSDLRMLLLDLGIRWWQDDTM
jgi:RNA polymerase sigma factor (sigma-70 family)